MAKWPNTEAELAAEVVRYLEDLQWEVYQEVQAHGGVADIVAVQANIVWVIECKKTFGFAVMEQAMARRPGAHFVSVAVPYRLVTDFRNSICGWKGIGVISVNQSKTVRESLEARFHRRTNVKSMLDRLEPEHKTFAKAGAAGGGHWTPFKKTCRALLDYVKKHPGAPLMEVVKNIKHHYASPASARGTLARWIRDGVVEGVAIEYTGRTPHVYPVIGGEIFKPQRDLL